MSIEEILARMENVGTESKAVPADGTVKGKCPGSLGDWSGAQKNNH
ncbi:MAG: hypothetical protein LUE87_06360 [Lachnospiraceae bacterium]|nr:hypothetical protein [Lachnospiraceae bacterium]